jgi:hypothetical protein
MEENKGERISDPFPHRALMPCPQGQGLCPLHSLAPADATPHTPEASLLSEGLRWKAAH